MAANAASAAGERGGFVEFDRILFALTARRFAAAGSHRHKHQGECIIRRKADKAELTVAIFREYAACGSAELEGREVKTL